MDDADFDVIVIGAGIAGLCCAGELVLQGARPLLICETREVGWTMRSQWIQGNRGVLQQPMRQLGWGRGWWYQLVRDLNLPVRIYRPLPEEATVRGSGKFAELPICASAASIADLLTDMSEIPLDEIRPGLERLINQALAMPDDELFGLDRVPMTQWLSDHGADEMTAQGVLNLAAAMCECPIELAGELSAFGAWALLRGMFAGEAQFVTVYPDAQDGLCVPIANEIERRGGAVWRARRVDRILTEGSQAVGVVLRDGTVARAPMVAVAAGNPRIGALFDELPPEVAAALTYAEQFATRDFTLYTLLDRGVVPPERARFTAIMDSDSPAHQWSYPIHAWPWTTKPGLQFVASQRNLSPQEVAAAGGDEAVIASMRTWNDELYPGFGDATVESAVQPHRHHWGAPMTVGPKLPRRSDSMPGLWFVGDGSAPVTGILMEAAAGAGVLGARAMAEAIAGRAVPA